jgi:MFS family permease
MGAWGGLRRRIVGILGGNAAWAACALLLGLGRSLPVWAVASFGAGLCAGVLMGASQALWQTKIAPEVQGRVFASRRLIAQLGWALSLALAGPLADRVFEPAMRPGGALAPLFGPLVGTGRGAGLALMATLGGVLMLAICLAAWLNPAVREVEARIPDHDTGGEPSQAGA